MGVNKWNQPSCTSYFTDLPEYLIVEEDQNNNDLDKTSSENTETIYHNRHH